MSTSAQTIHFDSETLWVELSDSRTIGVPLAWFPRLLGATPAQREDYYISPSGQGLHWDAIDEDISVPALVAGRGDMTRLSAMQQDEMMELA
jgi:hypothetical protein